ncbi:MAG TPA: GntR family transcriptional regulator [Firmicutes bacterium]|nr:GntR family transcriptional regulator [Bacillota bacterium]
MNDAKPVYLQLAENYKRLIDLGVYKEGDILPSVRELALAYHINPNTALRGYGELINENYAISIPKKGYYVLKKPSKRSKEIIYQALEPLLQEGYTKEEIKEAIRQWK